MLGYIGRRLLAGVIAMLVFSSLVFFIASQIMPGDYTCNFGRCDEGLAEAMGLNDPIWVQYFRFMGSLFSRELGYSLSGQPIGPSVFGILPWTLLVFIIAIGIAFWAGLSLGRIAAWSKRSWARSTITGGAVLSSSIFPPFLSFVLAYGFVYFFGLGAWSDFHRQDEPVYPSTPWALIGTILLAGAVVGVLARLARRYIRRRTPPVVWAVLYIPVVWLIWGAFGLQAVAVDRLLYFSPLIIVVVFLSFGEAALVVDASMQGVAAEDYVHTARAKGLPEADVRDRHAARLALLPALSRLAVSLPVMLTGMVIVEFSFRAPQFFNATIDYPGISSLLFTSLEQRDFLLTTAGLLVVGVIGVIARLIIDVMHAFLDPRVLKRVSEPI